MHLIMHKLVFQMLCLLFGNELVLTTSESDASDVFNIDHTTFEQRIAAIFNKVAHSSATTKRSVPAYEAQISQSTTHSTTPSSKDFSSFSTPLVLYPMVTTKSTNPPVFQDLPSYGPPSRALFTPPLPPEYANPFANKPTLRGTNVDIHQSIRRPIPPPSLTLSHERIPIKPPDLIEDSTKIINKQSKTKDGGHDFINKEQFEMPDGGKDFNNTNDYTSSLHITSISRILLGSNGRKQDIPEVLLKQISTKSPLGHLNIKYQSKEQTTVSIAQSIDEIHFTSSYSPIITVSNEKSSTEGSDSIYYESSRKNEQPVNKHNLGIRNNDKFSYSQPQPPMLPSEIPDIKKNVRNLNLHLISHTLEPMWKIALSLHVYLSALVFTLIALYSVYKIVRFNDATNLLTQWYFLTVHLLLTLICTLRCFHLFYDAYNLGHSLPEALSNILMFLPSSLLTAVFATLILYMFRCSVAQTIYHNKFWSPFIVVVVFIIYTTLSLSFYISDHFLGLKNSSKILYLICQCIYVIICVALGLCYMYVYRVIKTQLHISGTKSISNHMTTDIAMSTLRTAITITISTALLFILMGFVQLYGIFKVQDHLQPHFWLWWCWEFLVRVIELIICTLISWVASLSQYQTREKEVQQHVVHSGFALFPCGNSFSAEQIDDALYPAICSTNQAIHNYTVRTGKQVYDDSFPLNTLSEHLNVNNTFERHSSRESEPSNHFPQELRDSFTHQTNETHSFCKLDRKHQYKASTQTNGNSSASGSTMLVAEDGFVRFRNLGSEEDLTDSQTSVVVSLDKRRNSITCSDRFRVKETTAMTQIVQNHQNSMPHLHSSHRNHVCNDT